MQERFFEHKKSSEKQRIQQDLEASGVSDPRKWREAIDLESPLDGEDKIEPIGEKKREIVDIKNLDRIFTYLEGGIRVPNALKIQKFGSLKDGMDRLKGLQSMSVVEAAEAVRNFGLNDAAWDYLGRRLTFYQKFIAGEATRKVSRQKWDEEKREHVDVIEEEPLDGSYASPETIKKGLIRDIYYAGMQGTPEMGAVKIATKRVNEAIKKRATTENTGQTVKPIKSVVQMTGYYSGIYEGSFGQYPELSELYKKCERDVKRRFGDKGLSDKELEHRAVLLAAERLEGAFNYGGTLATSNSPYNAGFKESVIVGQLGHRVMRQMRGMRHRIQDTDFHNVERFIGKSGDNKYEREKKKLDKDAETLESSLTNNREAANLMTKDKNTEALGRAKKWFDKQTAKIDRWLEKSNSKISGYDISEEERESIYKSVQYTYSKKITDLQEEFGKETTRLESRSPEELLQAMRERKAIVDKRYEKRKSLAQKALDLHFRFNHEGRRYGSKPFNQIDWINAAPFGVIKRAHRALSAGVDEQTVAMRALAETKGESPDEQTPESFALNIIKSGNAQRVVENFERFSGITPDQHLDVLLAAIGNGAAREVVEHLNKFTGISPEDHLQIIRALNSARAGDTVVQNLEKFTGIGRDDERGILLDAMKGGGGEQVAQNFEKYSDTFSEDDHLEIAHAMSEGQAGAAVISNFQKFTGIPVEEHRRIVLDAIKGGGGYQVINNLEKFRGITDKDHKDIVLEIIKSGGEYYFNNDDKALAKFTGIEEGLRQVIKHGKFEALPQVLEAGFTIEEITRFPFLISPLVTRKAA